MPWPPWAAVDGEGARGTSPQPAGKGQRGQGLQWGAERIVTKWGQGTSGGRGRRGAGLCPAQTGCRQSWGSAGTNAVRPPRPASGTALPRGKTPGAQNRGLCKGSLSALRAEPWAQGRRCPAPRSLTQGGSWPRHRQPQLQGWAGRGQAGRRGPGLAIIAVEGHGGRRQAPRRRQEARTQRVKPGMSTEAHRVLTAARAEGHRAMGWGQRCSCPDQPSLRNDSPGTPCTMHPRGLCDPQQHPPTWGRGHSCQRRASEHERSHCQQTPCCGLQGRHRAKKNGARLGRC